MCNEKVNVSLTHRILVIGQRCHNTDHVTEIK